MDNIEGTLFQFYISTIIIHTNEEQPTSLREFQFYISTIIIFHLAHKPHVHLNFNSTKVRL